MKVYFSYKNRSGMNVASACADEIINGYNKGYEIGASPSRHEQRATLIKVQGEDPTFFYEGGIAIKPNLIDLCEYDEDLREGHNQVWVVVCAEVRYYISSRNGINDATKTSEIWDCFMLKRLYQERTWKYPPVASLQDDLFTKYPKLENEHYQMLLDNAAIDPSFEYEEVIYECKGVEIDDSINDNPVEMYTHTDFSFAEKYR